jgi:hypothetical protein
MKDIAEGSEVGIADDGWTVVPDLHLTFGGVAPGNARTVIEIREPA